MNRIILPAALLTATLALTLPAHATLLTRTFVSSAGSDSNPCTITQPCATFAHAYTLTAPSGIIAALDPGKYGPVSITGPITINGNGWAAITAPATGNGITINAEIHDIVALTGLNVDGAQAAYNGIVFNSGASLTVTNCVLQNFSANGPATGNGILIAPTTGPLDFTITNTTVANNNGAGIAYQPPSGTPNSNGVIDHVVATANGFGMLVNVLAVTGGTLFAAISNSIASNNGSAGIQSQNVPGLVKLSIDNVSLTGNGEGVAAFTTTNVLLGRSVITGNGIGVFNQTSPNTFYSYQNNQIDLNGGDVSGTTMNTSKVVR